MDYRNTFGNRRRIKAGLLLSCALAWPLFAGNASAALEGENLLQPLPAGFKVATQEHNSHAALTEMVPSAENVDNWSQMVTTQIYFGASGPSFEAYKSGMEQRWQTACDTTDSVPVTAGKENGYDFQIWMQACRHADATHAPEITWFKMIKGNDSTYVLQVAFHAEPQKEQVIAWMKYLKQVTVCDSRLKDRACPAAR
jgi:hypothetical protein